MKECAFYLRRNDMSEAFSRTIVRKVPDAWGYARPV